MSKSVWLWVFLKLKFKIVAETVQQQAMLVKMSVCLGDGSLKMKC